MNLYEELLEKSGGQEYSGYLMMLCPFKHFGSYETRPSMMVWEDTGWGTCKSCGRHAKVETLLRMIDKSFDRVSTKKISNVLPRWRKWQNKYGDIDGIVERGHKSLYLFPEHQWYFKARKIEQFIEQGNFGYIDGWALFPIMDKDGKIIDIVVRATKGKKDTRYVLHPDNEREAPYLYVPNWERVLGSERVYVTFGIVDAWSLEDIELPCITGTSGKSLNPNKLKELDKKYIIIPDKNEERDAYRLANSLGYRSDVNILKWPEGTKDCDNIRTKYGKEFLMQIIGA